MLVMLFLLLNLSINTFKLNVFLIYIYIIFIYFKRILSPTEHARMYIILYNKKSGNFQHVMLGIFAIPGHPSHVNLTCCPPLG